jgi:hypothetical protein
MVKALLILLPIAFAAELPPQHTVRLSDAVVTWRENVCAGFKANDCSVREPMTANVHVQFNGATKPVLIFARCKAKACNAERDEVAYWVEQARKMRR